MLCIEHSLYTVIIYKHDNTAQLNNLKKKLQLHFHQTLAPAEHDCSNIQVRLLTTDVNNLQWCCYDSL